MKYLAYALVLIFGLVFQTAGSPGFVLFSFKPEFMLLLALFFAMMQGPLEGAVFGFVSGFLLDLYIGKLIGLNALIFMIIAFGVGFITKRLYKENLLVRFLTVLGGTALGQVAYLLGMAAFGLTVSWSLVTLYTVVGTSIFNGVISLFLFRPFVALNERLIYWDELLKRTG